MGLVVAAVALPAMLWAVRDAQARRADPVMLERARWLAAEKLEDIIADRHSATRGYGYLANGRYPGESPVPGFPGFSRSVSIVETGPSLQGAGAGYKTVSVTVTYPAAAGAARSLVLQTVLTEYVP